MIVFLAMRTRMTAFFLFVIFFAFPGWAADAPDFTVKKIGEGVYAAISPDRSKAGSNAGFVVGSNGVLVVDTFVSTDPAKELLAEIRKVTDLPIRFVVNTHYHLDHTGGNAVFAAAGATILAHRNVRAWLRTENLKFFPNAKPEDKARVESLVLPDEVYSDAVDIYLGSRLVQVRYMLGHTGGDSVVMVPDANVVFGGDLIWQKHFPNLIDATTADWIKTLEKLLADHPSATFVSGHGDVASPQDVRDFRDYLVALREDIAQAQAAGKSGQELTDAVSAEVKEKCGEWSFQQFIPRNIQQTAAELKGEKKVPGAPANSGAGQ
ncbi:MAG TPA: MBL fold metallo-hydrolase [Candidatus Angelobacter sp.]|nr:MBL fold metallo-hydrolase [Candidatus Angelobacter sp.]